MTELQKGDTFRTADGEQYWQINEIERSFVLQLRPVNMDEHPAEPESAQYPEDVLKRKIERGDLEPVTFESEEIPEGEPDSDEDTEPDEGEPEQQDDQEQSFDCPDCDKSFETKRGRSVHTSQVHSD